jgi:hypothetical protein
MLAYLFWHRPYSTTTVKFSAQCIEAVLDTLSGQDEDVGHPKFWSRSWTSWSGCGALASDGMRRLSATTR